MDTRRMCPHCRAFITTKDKVCPYCNEEIGPKRTPTIDLSGTNLSYLTILILTLNAGLYLATALYSDRTGQGGFVNLDGRTLVLFGAKFGAAIFGEGQWWRLITAGFLHGGILHILMNSWVLFDLGVTATGFYGTTRIWLVYFVGTVTGFLASLLWAPSAISIGASAGLSALIGALIAIGIRYRSSAAVAVRQFYTRWFVYILIFGLMPGLNIDNAAHIGGLAGGMAVGYAAGLPGPPSSTVERVLQIMAYAAAALTLVSFYLMFRFFTTYNQVL